MKHFGDITKLSGYDLPVVDVITGGSPCQDLSVAGKRAGLDGERSGLFMEQIRITKEMRERDRATGRTGESVRPRYLVWENVPGAFSSNGGKDFQAVLTEIAKIAEPKCPDVPLPDGGKWSKSGALFGVGADGCPFSLCYRVHDAQFWGVPQRRKRIALVADFGGLTAPEILFERKGLSGDFEPCGEARQETAGAVGGGAEGTSQINEWCAAVNKGAKHQQDLIQHDLGVARTLAPGTHASGSHLTKTLVTSGATGVGGAISFQERGGKPGGGKGILIQREHVGALSTLNNQSVLQGVGVDTYSQVLTGDITCSLTAVGAGDPTKSGPSVLQMEPILLESNQNHATVQTDGISTTLPASMGMGGGYVPMVTAYGFSSYDSNAMKSPNPHSGIYEADTARTLDLNGGNPACNQGGVAIVQSVGCDVYNQEVTGDVAASLTAASGGTNTSGPKVLCLNDQGCSVMGVSEDVTGALRAEEHGHQPVVAFTQNQRNEVRDLGDIAGVLAAEPGMEQQTYVMAFKQGQGSKAGGIGAQEECAPTLSAVASGTNQVPAVYDARGNGDGKTVCTLTGDHQDRVTDYTALCVGNGQLNQMSMAEQANTLDTMHDQQAVMCFQNTGQGWWNESDIGATIRTPCGGDAVKANLVSGASSIVRRLTPLECERLQGYPDGWTNIGEWVDSKGKKHKDADSPRYKALGNSIALPFWQWMARRICAQYERTVTMGSLFDGIGGFPLVFQRCGAIPVWASEIEEFPIAVTKYHFPEEE